MATKGGCHDTEIQSSPTEQERKNLEAITRSGKTGAKKFIHARALLLCDAGPSGPAWKVTAAAEALGVTSRTIEHLKKTFCRRRFGCSSSTQNQGKAATRCDF